MKPDRESLSREERVSEMEEAFERVFEKLINRYASELGWWTLKKLGMFVAVVVVAAASMILYLKFPKL